MSGTFPSSPGLATVDLKSKYPVVVDTSESGKRYARNIGGHLWGVKAKMPPMTRAEFMPVYAFAMKQKGMFDNFQIVLPVISTPRGEVFPYSNWFKYSEDLNTAANWFKSNIGTITVDSTDTLELIPTSAAGGNLFQLITFSGAFGGSVLAFDVKKGTATQTKFVIQGMTGTPEVILDWGAGAAPTLNSSVSMDSVSITLVTGTTYRIKCFLTDDYLNGTYTMQLFPANTGSGNVEAGRMQASTGTNSDYVKTTTSAATSPAVKTTVVADVTTLVLENIPESVINAIRAGDVFKFSTHAKVYMITDDANTDSTGSVTINFEPPLIVGVSAGTKATFTDCPFTVSFEDSIQELRTNNPSIFNYEFNLLEAL